MISMLVPATLGSAGLLLCAPTSGVGRLTTPRHSPNCKSTGTTHHGVGSQCQTQFSQVSVT